jgi:mannose-binding lectin 1
MHITSSTLRSVAWSALALSTAHANYVIDSHSFGQDGKQISPNLRAIPHFHLKGEGWDPEIHSDRLLLTPPWPGNKRGALWSEEPLHHAGDWEAELSFRVSGMERGGGNLQIWYTKDSQKDGPPTSLYTAHKFDGLVLVLDQYEGRGGSVRGFLNDGNMDIKSHTDPDTLAFGQCDYAYRNLGRLSTIKLMQSHGVFEVTVDGHQCFSTNKVGLSSHPES